MKNNKDGKRGITVSWYMVQNQKKSKKLYRQDQAKLRQKTQKNSLEFLIVFKYSK